MKNFFVVLVVSTVIALVVVTWFEFIQWLSWLLVR